MLMPLTVTAAPFVECSLDTTMDNEDSPIIFLCSEDFGEAITKLEFDRLLVEGIIVIRDLPLPSAASDTGVKSSVEA